MLVILLGGLRGGYSPVFQPTLPLPVAIIVAVIASVAFAAAISVPYFRLRGAYFSIASLRLVLLVYYLVNNLRPFTGGPEGLHLLGHGEASTLLAYYLLLAVPVALASVIINYFVPKK